MINHGKRWLAAASIAALASGTAFGQPYPQ